MSDGLKGRDARQGQGTWTSSDPRNHSGVSHRRRRKADFANGATLQFTTFPLHNFCATALSRFPLQVSFTSMWERRSHQRPQQQCLASRLSLSALLTMKTHGRCCQVGFHFRTRSHKTFCVVTSCPANGLIRHYYLK